MAGEGARFGYTFKPFLKATENTFIELAKKPFEQLKKYGYNYTCIFVFRKSQEEQYNVSSKLNELFNDEIFKIHLIDLSDGPLQTIQQAVQSLGLVGPSFVCDCDHSIDILPIIKNIENLLLCYDVVIPTWNISKEEQPSFGKIILNKTNNIIGFCEKEIIDINENQYVKGLLGCHLFKEISIVTKYNSYPDISSLLKDCFKDNILKLTYIDIINASFFGTPKQLELFRFNRTKQYTLFVDIDGTLINQESKELLHGTVEKIKTWKKNGHYVILTTASQQSIYKYIEMYNIPYDKILYDLRPGPRIVINDKKPYLPYYIIADGINIHRNTGISNINLDKYEPPIILESFNGASMAKAYKVKDKNNNIFVRKHITKTEDNNVHVDTLKRQYEDLKRWEYYSPNLTPKILNQYESTSDYYYDLEYCENYKPLSCFEITHINIVLYDAISILFKDIYILKKQINDRKLWINTYLEIKVYPKFKILLNLDNRIDYLLTNNTITINNKIYKSAKYVLENSKDIINNFSPYYECNIHGDLSLENILYNKDTESFKLIDNSGSRYLDAIEMDIAKLFQSIICNFSLWDNDIDKFDISSNGNYNIDTKYIIETCDSNIYSWLQLYINNENNEDIHFVYKKGLFYMATYFIRMVPFMFEKSVNHAVFILLLSHIYLEKATN